MPTVTVPIAGVAPATPRSRLVTLDFRGHEFGFLAGQAVLTGAPGQARRPYSIACSPERAADTQTLELLIALEPDGTLGPHLPDTTPGSLVDVEGPMGTFVIPADLRAQRLLFVAGGSGIAPLRAMIDHLLRGGSDKPGIALLYSARSGDEFAFMDEFRDDERRGRLEMLQTVTRDDSRWAGGRGRIERAHFERVLNDAADTLCFVCGPRAMVNESVSTLSALGVPAHGIRTEAWVDPRG